MSSDSRTHAVTRG